MSAARASIREQLRSNAVALISLLVALSSLGYNTWRNERSEHNRNVRTAGFEILTKLAEFQRVVYLAHYDRDKNGGNPRTGWTYVIVIRDLAEVVPGSVPAQAAALQKVWADNWEDLASEDEVGVTRIDDAITRLRRATLDSLSGLH